MALQFSSAWDDELNRRLDEWRAQGLSRQVRCAQGNGVRISFRGKEVLSFASNDYLGLSTHPALRAAASEELARSGAGSGASPLICGHKEIHQRLEERLKEFKQTEAALVFPSGYQAALATLGALATGNDTVILDRLSHASLIDGATLSGARVRVFKHNDMIDLMRLLEQERGRRCVIVVESLYSMDGDLAPLQQLAEIAQQNGALLLVDEAHATGVIGAHGRGGLEALATPILPRHILAMGTLSKALASQGGFLCASSTVISALVHSGRAYLFSTALSPVAASAALAALVLIDTEPARRTHLRENESFLRAELNAAQMQIVPSNGPIVPLLIGDEERATVCSEKLFELGIHVPAIRFPTVKKGAARLRISLSAAHTIDDCRTLVTALASLR